MPLFSSPLAFSRAMRGLLVWKEQAVTALLAPVLLVAAFGPSPALATASLRCVSGPPVRVEVLGNLTHGLGNKLQSLELSLDAPTEGTDQDLARHAFTIGDVTQLWLDDDIVRLQLYWEREGDDGFGSSEVTILTEVEPDEEDVFSGRVTLAIFDNATGEPKERKLESTIECTLG